MPRLLGVEIPPNKRIEASLPYIYGIGPTIAKRVLAEASIDPDTRAKDLSPEQISQIVHIITNNGTLIEGDLRRELQGNLKRLQAVGSQRHPIPLPLQQALGDPAHGERVVDHQH